MQIPDLSNLALVAAVGTDGSPDAKRPRPDEEADPSDALAPTAGRWWTVNDGVFRVFLTKSGDQGDAHSRVVSIMADPTHHVSGDVVLEGGSVSQLWDKVTLLEERSLGQGHPVVVIYTARPNLQGYPLTPSEEQMAANVAAGRAYGTPQRMRLRDDTLVHLFGANKTSLPATRIPDEIHLIVNLLAPNPGGCGWCIMAVGVVPVPADDEPDQMQRLGELLVACPFLNVDIVRGE